MTDDIGEACGKDMNFTYVKTELIHQSLFSYKHREIDGLDTHIVHAVRNGTMIFEILY